MIEKIKKYKDDFKHRISEIGIGDELRQLRTDFLGKKGLVTQVMKDMRELSSEQKREVGQHINELKNWIENEIQEKTDKLKGSSSEGADSTFDVTLPG
ncbi:MAG: phenylalanine--tRNA ligase subunit alpha, partial [Nitrospinota bacterium]|nr:phenylalanine--tRNA ligase subunit alpha [Nitrospinota bacterium]